MSSPTNVTSTLRRQRGMTEEAAAAAVDQACRRLRLPTMRAVIDEATRIAEREQLSYQGFLAELLLAECDDRDRRSVVRRVSAAGFPRQGSVAKIVKLEHAWRRLDGRNDDGFQVAPFPG